MSEVTSQIELNDQDILRMEPVIKMLNDRKGSPRNLDAFRREAIERFEDVGFRVDVKVYDTNVQGVYAFDIEIQDRYEGKFDPDQMVWEATNDVLDLGTKGVLKTETTSSGLHVVGGKSMKHKGHKH